MFLTVKNGRNRSLSCSLQIPRGMSALCRSLLWFSCIWLLSLGGSSLSLAGPALATVTPASSNPNLAWDTDIPSQIDLQQSQPFRYTLTNQGFTSVQGMRVTLEMPPALQLADDFSDGCSNRILHVRASCTISGQLTALQPGSHRFIANLFINHQSLPHESIENDIFVPETLNWQGNLPEQIEFQHSAPIEYTLSNIGQGTVVGIEVALSVPEGLNLSALADGCSQQSLKAGQSCRISGQVTAEYVGDYQLTAAVSMQGGDEQQRSDAVVVPLPKTVKCPNQTLGSLFYLNKQLPPYRVMQNGSDAQAGVRNAALKSKLASGAERWCTSQVTDMQDVFYNDTSFNQPIGDWDVAQVTTMYQMFRNAQQFNQPIGDWDVSQVTNMYEMFVDAHSFDQPIGDWDVAQVTTMYGMFVRATQFNQPLAGWNHKTGRVTTMYAMFYGASRFNQDLTGWAVGKVTSHSNFNTGSGLPDALCPHFASGGCK